MEVDQTDGDEGVEDHIELEVNENQPPYCATQVMSCDAAQGYHGHLNHYPHKCGDRHTITLNRHDK